MCDFLFGRKRRFLGEGHDYKRKGVECGVPLNKVIHRPSLTSELYCIRIYHSRNAISVVWNQPLTLRVYITYVLSVTVHTTASCQCLCTLPPPVSVCAHHCLLSVSVHTTTSCQCLCTLPLPVSEPSDIRGCSMPIMLLMWCGDFNSGQR